MKKDLTNLDSLVKCISSNVPKNPAERAFFKYAKSKGWNVTKRGWPDFFCWKNGEIVIVEVKERRGKYVRFHQHLIMKSLAKYGIKCYRWDMESRTFVKAANIKEGYKLNDEL